MNKAIFILIVIALATVPLVGAVAIRALWGVPAEVISTGDRANAILDSLNRVETNAATAIGVESSRLNYSLDNLDGQVATIGPVISRAGPLLDTLNTSTGKLGHSIDLLNAPCIPAPCGTLADVNRTLATVRGTFGVVEAAALHEDRNLGTLDTQEATLFDDLHGTATRANLSLDTFNGLLGSPQVTIMLANGAEFTTTAVELEKKLAACTLHPTLPCVLKSDILFGAQVGGYLLR